MKLFQFPSGDSPRRGLPEHHLFQLDQLLRFIGARTMAPSAMFPAPWPTTLGTLAQLLYGAYFLLLALLNSKRKVLVYSLGPDFLGGETRLTDRHLRRRALWAAFHHKPFLIVSSDDSQPIARACSRLGVDSAEELTAYLVMNVVLIFFATKDGSPVVVHVGIGSPDIGLIAEQYRQWLEAANNASLPPTIRRLIPKLISFSGADGYWIVAQSRVPGEPVTLPAGDREFYELVERLLGPLLEFRSTAAEHVDGADHELIFETFPLMVERWPDLKETVDAVVTRLQDWQRTRRLVPILTHGDYWIRNLLITETGGEVTGIVDWDRSRRYGTPGFDALHLVMTALVERMEGCIADYLGQVWTGKWESDLLAAYVARVQREYSLSDEDIRSLGAMLYLNELVRMHFNRKQLSREHLQKLKDLDPAIGAWLARSEEGVSPSLTGA